MSNVFCVSCVILCFGGIWSLCLLVVSYSVSVPIRLSDACKSFALHNACGVLNKRALQNMMLSVIMLLYLMRSRPALCATIPSTAKYTKSIQHIAKRYV